MERTVDAPVIIIGGGRVGRAAGRTLSAAGLDWRIVEQQAERVRDPDPDPEEPLPAAADLVLIGDSESEHRFLSRYRPRPARSALVVWPREEKPG